MFSAFWKILMEGPPDTPYEKGVFELYCQFGPEYPVKPPLVRFVTQVSCHNTNNWKTSLFFVALLKVFNYLWSNVISWVVMMLAMHLVVLNMMTGVPLQCQQCGTHLPQHIWPQLQCPHHHERDPRSCVRTAHHPWAWWSTGQVTHNTHSIISHALYEGRQAPKIILSRDICYWASAVQ